MASADRRQRGSQPGALVGTTPPARASADRGLPPGGCGPIPRGGRHRGGRAAATARHGQRAEREGPPCHHEPVLPPAERRGTSLRTGQRGGHCEVATVEGPCEAEGPGRGRDACLTSKIS